MTHFSALTMLQLDLKLFKKYITMWKSQRQCYFEFHKSYSTKAYMMLFVQVCRWVLKYKTSKNPLIQMTILNLLPRLAAFQAPSFTGGTSSCFTVAQDPVESHTVTISHLLRVKWFTAYVLEIRRDPDHRSLVSGSIPVGFDVTDDL